MRSPMFTKNDSLFIITAKANRYISLLMLIWMLATLYCILYILTNQQTVDDEDAIDLLRKAYEDLSVLEERYTQLQKLVVKLEKNLVDNKKIQYAPKLEYELLRRRIVNDLQEFWNFLSFELIQIKTASNLNSDTRDTLKKVLSMGIEYKRVLSNSMEKISQVDGYDEWRNSEIKNLSKIVQNRLYYLQNPVDCKNAKKLICSINYPCGFGCQIHHLVSCMTLAYGTQRTLILDSTNWQYHKEGWDKIFKPLSDSCTSVNSSLADKWPGNEYSHLISIPVEVSILPRPDYLPLAVPEDLASRLILIHGNPIVWWIGQILKYIWKPQNVAATYIDDKIKELRLERPFVGIHIRRSDKVGSEASYHFVAEYMSKVDEYYKQLEMATNNTKKVVYIATDDFKAITEAKTNYPYYEIVYNQNISKHSYMDPLHANDNLLDVILDVHILSQSNFLVCTFSSNICRLAYELMQNHYVDASSRFASLDDVYYYSQQLLNKRKVLIKHKAQTPQEIDLLPGDIVHIAGNHWNGYSLGKNLRTQKEGLYLGFKTEIEPEVIKFPTYSKISTT